MTHPSILFVNRVAPPASGATGRLMMELIDTFKAQGWNARYAAARIYTNHKIINAFLSLLVLTATIIRQRRHQIIVLMTDPPFLVWQVFLIRLISSARVIHWCHDLYPDLLPAMNYKFPRLLLRTAGHITQRAMHRCDAVVPIGSCMAAVLQDKHIPTHKIHPITNWAPLNLQRHPFAAQDKMRVLYAGNMGLNHPLHMILDAARHFQNDPRLEFIFSGSGRQKAALQKIIQDQNLQNCCLQGFVADDRLNDMLASGDIHIVTMQDAAAGLLVPCKIYSAAAVGRPTIFIGDAASEAAQYLTRHKAGWVLPHDSTALIAFLARAASDLAAFHDDWQAAFPLPANDNHSIQQFVKLAESLT